MGGQGVGTEATRVVLVPPFVVVLALIGYHGPIGSVLSATVGSWGDLFPLVGVGVELQRRGHDVRVGASPAWEAVVAEAGLDFVPLGPTVGFREFAQHPEILRTAPFGLRSALGHYVFDHLDELTEQLDDALSGTDVVVTHPAQLAAQNVAERRGVPRVTATTFPSMLPSAHSVPGGAPVGPWSGRLGRGLNRISWGAAAGTTSALFDREINRHRRRLGLRPVRSALLRLPMAADRTIVMAAPIAERHPDWPASVSLTPFVLWDQPAKTPDPALEEFLAAGDAPVLVTLGASGAIDPGDFFEQVIGEVLRTGSRALAARGPAPTPVSSVDPAQVHVTDFVPFGSVAHRCRAAVHHAGIGTTASMMNAGIPHLVFPRAFDQPVTAREIERLGVGISIPWRQRRRRLGRGVRRLIEDAGLRQAAADLGARFPDDGAEAAADLVEDALGSS